MNSSLSFPVWKLYQKIFLQKMVMSTDPFPFREMWLKTQVVPLSFWRALTLGEMQIFACQELDERIDTNVISACWKWNCGQQPVGFSSTFRLETGNRAACLKVTQCSNYLIVVRKSKMCVKTRIRGRAQDVPGKIWCPVSSLINTVCLAYLHFICQYFQWFTILTEHKTRHNWIPSCCGAKVTAQLFSCESRVMWLRCRKVTWLHILLSWKQHCFQSWMLLYLCFQYCPAFFFQHFFSDDQSISKPKSVLIGSRGLREALCQWWWGSWLVQRHRQPTDPC